FLSHHGRDINQAAEIVKAKEEYYFKKNNFSLKPNNEKTEVNLKIDDSRTDKFIAKMKNSELNIYQKNLLLF
ncbi:MAG: hypothetical protein QMD06_02115, partial [Candidatus Altarchaeum sp.]|nr:hypothetical protein [Candidatus Altarchaeum sp.]